MLLVPVLHFRSFYFGDTLPERLYLAASDLGFIAVDVFFVLSGYLITGILLDTTASPSYFRRFYGRRCLRIFPLYYAFLAIYFVLLPVLAPRLTDGLQLTAEAHAYYWSYLLNVAMALAGWANHLSAPWTPAAPATVHFWSLCVEEQFYLVWPLIVRLCGRKSLERFCLACLAIAPAMRAAMVLAADDWINIAAYVLTPARIDGLALGGLIAIRSRVAGGLAGLRRWAIPVLLFATAAVIEVFRFAGHLPALHPGLVTIGITASVYLSGALLVLCLEARADGWWRRLLMTWPLQRIGTYSYGIYVLHYPVVFMLSRAGFVDREWFARVGPTRLTAELMYLTVVLMISIGAGALSWHLLEAPVLKLRRFLPYEFSTEQTTGRPLRAAVQA